MGICCSTPAAKGKKRSALLKNKELSGSQLLSDADFAAVDTKVLAQLQDLSQPLSHYFVSSSHNTYMTGGQFVFTGGDVDINTFSDAIRSGCRCVELDCYDGDEGSDDIKIYHGAESLSGGSLSLKAVLLALAAALPGGALPLLLNCENHFSDESVAAVFIAAMKEQWGDKLVKEKELQGLEALPSPEALRGKVMIRMKNKKGWPALAEIIALKNRKFKGADNPKGYQHFHSSSIAENKLARKLYEPVAASGAAEDDENLDDDEDDDEDAAGTVGDAASSAAGGVVVGSVTGDSRTRKGADDAKGDAVTAQSAATAVRYNAERVTRVYPKALAALSENYSPMRAWEGGCQVAALNWQTEGEEMDLNAAMFARGGPTGVGGGGYVLKPACLRPPFSADRGARPLSLTLFGVVHTGKREAFGVAGVDRTALLFLRARVLCANAEPMQADSPAFTLAKPFVDHKLIAAHEVSLPELAFVRFELYEEGMLGSTLLASRTIWLLALANGVRCLELDGRACAVLGEISMGSSVQQSV